MALVSEKTQNLSCSQDKHIYFWRPNISGSAQPEIKYQFGTAGQGASTERQDNRVVSTLYDTSVLLYFVLRPGVEHPVYCFLRLSSRIDIAQLDLPCSLAARRIQRYQSHIVVTLVLLERCWPRYPKVCPKSISCFSSDSRFHLDDSIVHLFQSYTNGFLDAFVSIGLYSKDQIANQKLLAS